MYRFAATESDVGPGLSSIPTKRVAGGVIAGEGVIGGVIGSGPVVTVPSTAGARIRVSTDAERLDETTGVDGGGALCCSIEDDDDGGGDAAEFVA